MFYPTNPAIPVQIFAEKHFVPNPTQFHTQMLKTFNGLIKVTKKTVQKNLLEKMMRMNISKEVHITIGPSN